MKRLIKMSIPIFILLILFIYILTIDAIPEHITLFEGENINFRMLYGMKINKKKNEQIVEAVSNQKQK